jgi:hypothetical protein
MSRVRREGSQKPCGRSWHDGEDRCCRSIQVTLPLILSERENHWRALKRDKTLSHLGFLRIVLVVWLRID